MKNTFFIIAIILLAISLVATPFIFKYMNTVNVNPPETTEITETTEPVITEETEVVETTVPPTTEPVTEPTATLATEVTIPPTENPTIPVETEAIEEVITEPTEAQIVETTPKTVINEVPLYNQWDYPNVYYGERENVSVATHGDGMTTLAMIATYLKDDPSLTPDVIANMFGYHDSENGTSWTLFTDAAEKLELGEVRQAWDWNVGEIEKALRDGSIVACCVVNSPFSEKGGHYILLTGITEDGKIMVNDSNGYNYDSLFLKPMFKNGFEAKYIYDCAKSYWIYPAKSVE